MGLQRENRKRGFTCSGTCLVTGVAGFIGSHLAERLLEEGSRVIGIDSFASYYPRAIKEQNLAGLLDGDGFVFVEGDLCTLDLAAMVSKVDVIFHEAAQPGVRSSWGSDFSAYCESNILATQRLLKEARQYPIHRFIYASSSSVYGAQREAPFGEHAVPQPISPYGITKLAGEHLCGSYFQSFGVPTVSLRYFTVFGPRQRPDMAFHRFIDRIMRGEPVPVYGDGEQTRDFTYVLDAVTATILAANRGKPGRIYNIAGGCIATINECIRVIEHLLGKKAKIAYEAARPGDPCCTQADVTLAREDLGFEPSFSLEAGLSAQIAHLRKEYGTEES